MISISHINIGQYITAYDTTPEGKKTKVYYLCSEQNEFIQLGVIKWYSAWRQYCFFPENERVFNKTCLKDIMYFLEKLNRKEVSE